MCPPLFLSLFFLALFYQGAWPKPISPIRFLDTSEDGLQLLVGNFFVTVGFPSKHCVFWSNQINEKHLLSMAHLGKSPEIVFMTGFASEIAHLAFGVACHTCVTVKQTEKNTAEKQWLLPLCWCLEQSVPVRIGSRWIKLRPVAC